MSLSTKSRRVRPVLTSAIALGVLALTVGGAAAPAAAAESAATCTVTDGTLTWGIKESFRSYISGTIAKGAWETSEGATYETPVFTWSGGQGEIDAKGTGEIAFPGAVTFTGHGGLLSTTFANPTIVFEAGQSQLLIDVSGISMEDALAGNTDAVVTQAQVPMVALGLDSAALGFGETGEIAASDVTTTVTAEGYAAFSNYEEGSTMDPLSFAAQLECAEPVVATPAPEESVIPIASEDAAAVDMGLPAALWWGIGAGALVVAGGVTAWALRRRGKSDAGVADDSGAADGSGAAGGVL